MYKLITEKASSSKVQRVTFHKTVILKIEFASTIMCLSSYTSPMSVLCRRDFICPRPLPRLCRQPTAVRTEALTYIRHVRSCYFRLSTQFYFHAKSIGGEPKPGQFHHPETLMAFRLPYHKTPSPERLPTAERHVDLQLLGAVTARGERNETSCAQTLGSWVGASLEARMSVCAWPMSVLSCVGSGLRPTCRL
jgi:hypothetical protein